MTNERGITLIEILISLLVASILMAGIYRLVIKEAHVATVQHALANTQNEARAGMEFLVTDLRMAGYDRQAADSLVGIGTANPITPVAGGSNWVQVAWEENNTTIKAVRYSLSGGSLVREIFFNGVKQGDTEVVVENVEDLTFSYVVSGVTYERINISMTVSSKTGLAEIDSQNLNRTLVSMVIFRNAR